MQPNVQQPIEPDWFARITSLVALALAGFSLYWTIRKDRKDRAKIKATAKLRGFRRGSSGGVIKLSEEETLSGNYPDARPCLEILAENIGRRPVRIVAICGRPKFPKLWQSIDLYTWPNYTLNEADHRTLDAGITDSFRALRTLALKDSAGKVWNVSRRDFKQAMAKVEGHKLIK